MASKASESCERSPTLAMMVCDLFFLIYLFLLFFCRWLQTLGRCDSVGALNGTTSSSLSGANPIAHQECELSMRLELVPVHHLELSYLSLDVGDSLVGQELLDQFDARDLSCTDQIEEDLGLLRGPST